MTATISSRRALFSVSIAVRYCSKRLLDRLLVSSPTLCRREFCKQALQRIEVR